MEENSIGITSKPRSLVLYEKYMLVMGVAGQMIYYMQGIKIFLNRSAQDVSILGFGMGLIAVLSWLTYGLLIKNRVLIIANLFGVLGALFVLAGIVIYR